MLAWFGGIEVDVLDLSRLTNEYDLHIHPCKGCVSTAMPLCHWPCSCYPNHAMGQTNDWMAELYPRWVAAHGVLGAELDVVAGADHLARLRHAAARLGLHFYPGGMVRYISRLGLNNAKRLFLTADKIEHQCRARRLRGRLGQTNGEATDEKRPERHVSHRDHDGDRGDGSDRPQAGDDEQAYAVEAATIQARRQGYSVTEQPLADGSIKLTVNVGSLA